MSMDEFACFLFNQDKKFIKKMACPLLNLSAELQFLIFRHLQSYKTPEELDVQTRNQSLGKQGIFERDLRNLSLTCNFYYTALLPYTFEKLVLQNNETSASSILRCMTNAARNYILFTKELWFTDTRAMKLAMEDEYFANGHRKNNSNKDDENEINIPELCRLPTSAAEILSSLSRFPNLNHLLIHWRFHDSDWYIEQYAIGGETEDDNGAAEWEEQSPWRALMRDVYNAVSKNVVDITASSPPQAGLLQSPPMPPILKSLEIKNSPMHPVSSYLSPTFHHFLSTLHSFKLSLMTADNIGHYAINTCFQYQDFTSKLDTYFLNHLSIATSLHIAARDGPLGSEDSGPAYCPLSLPLTQRLPALKRLVLDTCFITAPSTIDFFVRHARSLEHVKFFRCFSDDVGNTWCKLFEALARAGPERLVEFCVEPAKVKFKEASWRRNEGTEREAGRCEALLLGGDEDEEERGGRCVVGERRGAAGRRGRRAFCYGYIDDKYGFVAEIPPINREMLLRGEDQRAYDALMEIVERNRRRLMAAESRI
ncbi:hypothetical protein BDDG_00737 [Blastomyces dermatitidis ATCC 18188]|uniref:F-box domain-containing protein n=1 Tax=Ajellomyces dermatitidis (strain ATCC 18188 / CBS 674.68) TaxID=653446 RepID=F2T4E1_AJEDA|nr:hypothetical protein BDDG_00737 [Blastomyces dermatitidis ATCC 18188]